jgi:NAD+ synthase
MKENQKNVLVSDSIKRIQGELETYISKNNIKSLVIGISGGIDSALCAALARPVCDKLEIPLIGRSIPISTNTSEERDRAEAIGEAFCTDFDEDYQMESVYDAFWSILSPAGWDIDDPRESFRKGNLKARLRMIRLYDLAQLHRGMVLSTDNYTELLLGFWTLHGDVGDYGMIQKLWKSEVYDLSEHMLKLVTDKQAKALKACIECQATDGLGITSTDLDQIMPGWTGSSREGYAYVDKCLFSYQIGVEMFDGQLMQDHPVIKRHLASEFKRNNPFNIRRDLIIPEALPDIERKNINVCVHHRSQSTPYTKEYLDKLGLEPDDAISIQWNEEYGSEGEFLGGWDIDVQRTRMETDEELEERVKRIVNAEDSRKNRSYATYLKLKKEFES